MLQCFSVYAVCMLSSIAHGVRHVIPLHALDVSVVEYASLRFVCHLLDVPYDLPHPFDAFFSRLLNVSLKLVTLLSISFETVWVMCVWQAVGLYARQHRVKVALNVHETETLESRFE